MSQSASGTSSASLTSRLTSHALFRSLDATTLQALERELERIHLQEGDALFQQGDAGDSLYVLIEGRLGVRIRDEDGAETVVDELEPGVTVGEMALLTGQPRVATVYALEEAALIRLSKAGFERLAHAHPQLLERFTEAIMPRLQRTELAGLLRQWFGEMETAELHTLQAEIEWIHLTDGEALFRQGEPGETMYLVVNGRLQIVLETADGSERIMGEVSRGESVGEFAVLTDEPRSATVYAIRDTDVIEIPRLVVQQYPLMLAEVTRVLIHRTQRSLGVSSHDSSTAATCAILPTGDSAPLSEFTQRLVAQLNDFGPTLHLNSERFDREFGMEGVSQIGQDHPTNVTLTGWLNQKESEYRYIVFEADPTWTVWTQRCVRQADRILLIAPANADPALSDLEQELRQAEKRTPVDLVLIQPDEIERPQGTIAWLTPRTLNTHHHVRMTHQDDLARLVRRLTGRAIGLVFSGGGARGYAHIGLTKALEELDIPVDLVGGTSMGSLIAGAYAVYQKYEPIYEGAISFGDPKKIVDYTFPFVSLAASKSVTRLYQTLFEDIQIEDLWIPFFCVSANLTRAEPVVHQRGPLWRAVRASAAIPGIFAPILDEGDVLVDGGVINNFPVDIMVDKIEGGIIIGSNAYPSEVNTKSYNFDDSVSGWKVLWGRINPFATKIKAPSIFGTLTRATGLNSKYQMNAMDNLADLVIHHPVEGFRSLQFDRYDDLIKIGYEASKEALQAWQRSRETGG